MAVLDGVGQLLDNGDSSTVAKTFGVRGDNLDRALHAYQAMLSGRRALLPAWQRYTGVVWSALEPDALTPEQRGQILIPSAFYGVTTALDQIADYRLTFKVALPGIGNLSKFWSEGLSETIARHVAGATVVDLLPAEHARVLDYDALAQHADVVRVEFVKANGIGAAGHGAKAVKGLLSRHLLDEGVEAVKTFTAPGWRVRHRGDTIQIVEV